MGVGRARSRIGNITRNTAGVPNTRTRKRPRNMGSSVRVAGLGRPLQMPGATARVRVTEVVQDPRRATSAVAVKVQATGVAESLKQATSLVVATGAALEAAVTVQ